MTTQGFIPPHGHYQSLLSYRKAEIVYEITFHFCRRFLTRGDRTIDQMVQAARSGKQNIVEGSAVSGTSKEMEIKLTNVARASLEELLVDYQDFLRVRGLPLWDKDSKQALFVRRLGRQRNRTNGTTETNMTKDSQRSHESHQSHDAHESFETYREFIETRPADVVANIAICLIHQTNFLMDRQIKSLEADFLKHGGVRERMTRARLRRREGRD